MLPLHHELFLPHLKLCGQLGLSPLRDVKFPPKKTEKIKPLKRYSVETYQQLYKKYTDNYF